MVDANSAFLFRRRPWMAFSGPAAKISIARVVSVVSRRRFPGFSTIRFSLRTHDGPVGYLRRRGRSRARRWRRRSNANRRNVGPAANSPTVQRPKRTDVCHSVDLRTTIWRRHFDAYENHLLMPRNLVRVTPPAEIVSRRNANARRGCEYRLRVSSAFSRILDSSFRSTTVGLGHSRRRFR